ncbi:hypothetical protein ACQ86N_21630 [Puia sp. P3]|uniref:hypothetical protein n=1 Tax=Puia sp. P3 TaxID=3423952 RepID=UPI003D665FB3
MSQEPCLFDDTIYNNIRSGRPEASEIEILEAAEKAWVLDFALELRDGIHTRIGEGGLRLTSGQRRAYWCRQGLAERRTRQFIHQIAPLMTLWLAGVGVRR